MRHLPSDQHQSLAISAFRQSTFFLHSDKVVSLINYKLQVQYTYIFGAVVSSLVTGNYRLLSANPDLRPESENWGPEAVTHTNVKGSYDPRGIPPLHFVAQRVASKRL